MLVDSGMPRDSGKITNNLKEIGLLPSDITAILITHADYDHAGTAAFFQSLSGAFVIGSRETCRLLAAGQSPSHLPSVLEYLSRPLSRFKPVAEEALIPLNDGDFIEDFEDWQTLSTPGHSPDHFAFFSQVNGILFAGDALFCRGESLKLGRGFMTGNPKLAVESARRLLMLAPAVVACGHGTPKLDHSADDLMVYYKALGKKP